MREQFKNCLDFHIVIFFKKVAFCCLATAFVLNTIPILNSTADEQKLLQVCPIQEELGIART